MDLSRLASLKERLLTAKEFKEVWTYFLDHFGENMEFMNLGERTNNPMLDAILAQVAKQTSKINVDPAQTIYTLIPSHGFIHGGYAGGGKMVNVIYFEDVSVGSIMITVLGDPQIIVMRFTGQPLPKRTEPSMN